MRGIPIRHKNKRLSKECFICHVYFYLLYYITRFEELILNNKNKPSDYRGDGKKGKPTTNRPVPRP